MAEIAAGILLVALVAAILLLAQARARLSAARRRIEASHHDLERLQQMFTRFAPASVVEEIIANGVSRRAEARIVTVLFADLKGFSALSERVAPEVLVSILNRFFSRMSFAIVENRGHVAKFIGDGILAHFGALDHNPWQSQDAVRAALRMQGELARLNETFEKEGLPRLAMGIGVHHGPAVAGVIGSRDLVEYTVIGRNVNLAARIEKLTRKHHVGILISSETAAELDDSFHKRPLPQEEIRGMSAQAELYVVEEHSRALLHSNSTVLETKPIC